MSLIGRYGLYGGLLPLALYVGVMAIVARTYRRRPTRLVELVAAMSVAATISGLAVALASRGFAEIDPSTGQLFTAPVGLQGHPNLSGAFLGMAVPSFAYLVLRSKGLWSRALLVCGLALDLAALGTTRSRGGVLAAVCGLAVMAAALARPLSRRRALAVVGVGALAGAALWSAWLQPTMRRAVDAPEGSSLLRAKTAQIRLWAWESAARAVADHPLFGAGPDTFDLVHPRYRGPLDGAYLGSRLTGKPHNVFLERAVDTGLPGGAGYVALVGVALWRGVRRGRRLPRESRLVLACFAGTLAAYAAQGFVSFDTPNLAMPGWVALGAIAAVLDHHAADPYQWEPTPPRRRTRLWTIPIAVGLVVVACVPALADIRFRVGDVERARRLDPWETIYPTAAANRALAAAASAPSTGKEEALLRRALDDYQAALRVQGPNVFPTTAIARTYTRWAQDIDPRRFADAERWWQRAVGLDPRNGELRIEHAAMLSSWASATGDERAASGVRRERAAAAAAIAALRRR